MSFRFELVEKTLLWIFGRNTGGKPNGASAGTSGGQERLFHLSTIPRGKKSEDTDHLTPPTEAAPVGAALQQRGKKSKSIIPLMPLWLLRDKRWSARTDEPVRVNKKVLSVIWLESGSPRRHSINIITSLILNKYYSFLKSLPRPRFCGGAGEGAAWPKSETRSFEQE